MTTFIRGYPSKSYVGYPRELASDGAFTRQADIFSALVKPAAWFKERFDRIKDSVPPFLRPKFFAIVISEAAHETLTLGVQSSSPNAKQEYAWEMTLRT